MMRLYAMLAERKRQEKLDKNVGYEKPPAMHTF